MSQFSLFILIKIIDVFTFSVEVVKIMSGILTDKEVLERQLPF